MILAATRRRGALSAMTLAVIALVLAFIALVLTLVRDPMQSGFAMRNPFGDPLSKYDVETAAGAAIAQETMFSKGDIRAMLEYDRRIDRRNIKEKLDSFKVEKEKDFKAEKDPKDKKNKGSGEFKILFVSFKRDGDDVKEIMTMEKEKEGNLWTRGFIGDGDVEKKDKELAKEMREWRKDPNNKFPN